MTNDEALKLLENESYMLEYNPNCPARFLVRLCNPHIGRMDEMHDFRGYGKTLGEAAEMALQNKTSAAAKNRKIRKEKFERFWREVDSRR